MSFSTCNCKLNALADLNCTCFGQRAMRQRFACLWNLSPREVEKDRDPGSRPSDWTTLELTSSWLAMYLGRYLDRRYHCERGDKFLQGSLWRRCVPPWACSDSHQSLSTPLLSLPLLGAKDCGRLLVGSEVCVGRDRVALGSIVRIQEQQNSHMTQKQVDQKCHPSLISI